MQQYPDPEKHFEEFMLRSAEEYARGPEERGLQPNATLTWKYAGRAIEAAEQDYERQAFNVLKNNTREQMRRYHRRDQQIRREGAGLAVKICPLIILILAVMTWLHFSHENWPMAIIYGLAAFIFLVMLLAAVFRKRN